MSPIQDPRFSPSRWSEIIEKERAASARAGRLEYIKPAVMLVVGGGIVMAAIALGNEEAAGGSEAALVYLLTLGIELVVGVVGLWLACKLWIGGAGPLGLAILRLAGIYAFTDLVMLVTAPLLLLSWLITVVVYVALLAWLFELEARDSIMLAVITWVLKLVAGAVFVMCLMAA